MVPVVFSIGSNIGDKITNIKRSLDGLNAIENLTIDKASSFYKTPPWGIENQDWFVNICASGQTSLPPSTLLAATQSVEKKIGREKTIRWGPRLIDIDILFYGDKSIDIPDLTIPHKSIAERAFVLVPLEEIARDIRLNNKTIQELMAQLPDETATITQMANPRWMPQLESD